MYFSQFADEVTILYRGESLAKGMSRYLVDQIEAIPSISVRLGVDLVGLEGNGSVEAVSVRGRDGGEERLPASGVFVFVGALPNTAWLDGVVARDDSYTGR